ncbi:PepSY-associated TM helix domain-containing protein [Pseudoalteromonas sp. ZZD1]|uniref:PepSY-associated TM helix domain-containing protein n=1 Tax=Pseudoalteromonas sp. ZZD1 TaxID=3139395 RepID=UPI003BAB9931
MKLWLRRTHLLLTLISGIFLICLSVTGAILIYAKDMQRLINPELWTVEPKATVLAYPELINTITSHTQQDLRLLMPEQNREYAWQIQLADKQYASVNPYTGEILLQYDFYSTLYGFTMSLHRWLLYQDSEGNRTLRNWVSISALIFIINMLIGVYLWIKPKNRLKRLVIKPKAKLRILLYQLHTVLGMYVFLVLILIAFSGMAFNWKDQTKAVLEFTTQSNVESRPKPPILTVPTQANSDNFELALKNALSAFPQSALFRIYFPKQASEPLALRVKNPGESHAYSWVWANQYTGQVLQTYDASKANLTTQAWNFKYKFHIGDFAGSFIQLLWLLIALLPMFFTLSGLYFWYKRHYR